MTAAHLVKEIGTYFVLFVSADNMMLYLFLTCQQG